MKPAMLLFLLLHCVEATAIKPLKEYRDTPDGLGMPYTEHVVKAGSANITTWLLPQKDTTVKKTIILCNSDYGNMSYVLPLAKNWYDCGFNVILFDYRGFGQSSPFAIDSNRLFYEEYSEDFLAVFSFYKNTRGFDPRVYASSMGTIIATIAYGKQPALFTQPFVFDSFIESPDYTLSYLREWKNRPFSAPFADAQYVRYVDELKAHPTIFLRGSADLVAHPAGTAMTAESPNWTTMEFKGGHLQAPYILGEKLFGVICE